MLNSEREKPKSSLSRTLQPPLGKKIEESPSGTAHIRYKRMGERLKLMQCHTLSPKQNVFPSKATRWRLGGWLVVLAILFTLGHGCFRSTSIEGLPCEFDTDCLHFRCIQKVCGGPVEGVKPAEQQTEATSKEGVTPKEATPTGNDAGPEMKPETPHEQIVEQAPEQVEGKRTLHQPCLWWQGAPAAQRCASGFLCVRSSEFDAFCLQDCSSDATLCTSNQDRRTECLQLSWDLSTPRQPLSACLDIVGKDFPCDLTKSIACKRSSFNHLVCIQGKCVEGTLAKGTGSPCGLDKQPPVECDITKEITCSSSINNTCQLGAAALEGDECGNDRYCQPGFTCIGQKNGLTVCMKDCDINKPASESCPNRPNFVCLPTTQGGGVCAQEKCTSYHDCAFKFPPHECTPVAGYKEKICFPFRRGPQPLGAPCDTTFNRKDQHCQTPLSCVLFERDPNMTACVPQCRFDADCKPFSSKMICDPTIKSCVWPCLSTSDCPDGLECTPSTRLCASKDL